MSYSISIPKDQIQAEKTLSFMLEEGKAKRAPQAVSWWTSKWYMRGVRDFQNIDYKNGSVQVSYMNENGVLNFKFEDIVSKYQAQLGRILQLDLTPIVSKEGISLDGMRKASIGQVVLSSIFSKPYVDKILSDVASNLLLYGTVAIIPWWTNEDSIGFDVAPPWEILPIPVEVDSDSKKRGLIRRKLVPLDWVKELPVTPRGDAQVYKDMRTQEVPAGYIPVEAHDKFRGSVMVGAYDSSASQAMETTAGGSRKPTLGTTKDKTRIKVVEAAEVWTMTEDNHWDEFILYVGGKIVHRKSYKGERREFPPQIITDVDVGNFWGRSFVEQLIPLNCENEAAIARLFQNVKEWDLYGIIYEPTTSGINTRCVRGSDGLKRVKYEPDPIAPDHKPFNITMGHTGLLPAKVLEAGMMAQSRIANQPNELMGGGAPGRVDSASGLGFLFETSNVPLTPTAKAIAQAFTNCYRVVLDITRRIWGEEKLVDITHLDDSIAGVTVDQRTGQIRLTDNAIPHPSEVVVSVRSAIPRSKEQQKMELSDALAKGIVTLTEYNIMVRKAGLDLPVGDEVSWQNYRRATLENIVMFGDGERPGEIIFSDNDVHPVHLLKLDEFMAKPEFYLAAPAVRAKFVKHRQEHLAAMGQVPDDMPYAEDAAEESIGMMDAQMQMQMQGQPQQPMM